MGLLDELKKEAQKKEELERQRNAELAAQQAFYDEHLRPVMRRVHDYFSELVEQLNKVEPDVHPEYPLAPEGQPPVVLKQGNYNFRSDDFERPRTIIVRAECELEKQYEFFVRTGSAVTRYAALLDDHKLRYHSKNHLDEKHDVASATFTLEGPLAVQIRLRASAEDRCVHIDLLNIEAQPLKRYKLQPEKVDETLLDRLARMLIREESMLVEVKISEDARAELRRKLEQEKLRQQREQAQAQAWLEAERRAEEEARLLNRAKRSLGSGIKKLFSKDD